MSALEQAQEARVQAASFGDLSVTALATLAIAEELRALREALGPVINGGYVSVEVVQS